MPNRKQRYITLCVYNLLSVAIGRSAWIDGECTSGSSRYPETTFQQREMQIGRIDTYHKRNLSFFHQFLTLPIITRRSHCFAISVTPAVPRDKEFAYVE